MTPMKKKCAIIPAAILAAACAAILLAHLSRPRVTPEPELPQLPYYHADSIEARRWKRVTYLDSLQRHRVDSVQIPYRTLFEEYADSCVCDWRMLAAIACKESNFDMHARSRRGARGLMQLSPVCIAAYNLNDAEDPRENIRVSVLLLNDIAREINRHVADPGQAVKFLLAAYNAGSSRIKSCVDTLAFRGIEVKAWEDIVNRLDELEDFHGKETTAFVEKVLSTYKMFQAVE